MNTAKSLTEEPPRSPRSRLGGYALMARMIDKGRADLAGNAGEDHYACPLDQMLFDFKGVEADEVRKVLASGVDRRADSSPGSTAMALRRRPKKSRPGPTKLKHIVPTMIRKKRS